MPLKWKRERHIKILVTIKCSKPGKLLKMDLSLLNCVPGYIIILGKRIRNKEWNGKVWCSNFDMLSLSTFGIICY